METAIAPASTVFAGDLTNTASQKAGANFQANLAAVARFQPQLADRVRQIPLSLEWLFARDGTLTARNETGWWTGCSVPLLAGREFLKKLEMIGPVGCFLNPTHAGQIRACFEKLSAAQAIIAVVPELTTLAVILHCEDFTPQIAGGRLLFAGGENWAEELAKLFRQFPGLPMPQQFLRTALIEDADMPTFTIDAQRVISEETTRRAEEIATIVQKPAARTGRVLVLASSQPKLADFSNVALASALIGDETTDAFVRLDPDHPLSASPLALSHAAADVEALIAADLFRGDLPGLVASHVAWITWITSDRVAPPSADCPHDGLLLADARWRKAALEAGWRADRVQLADWPRIIPLKPVSKSPLVRIGLLADTRVIEVPKRVKEYSSQLLLWEMIEEELSSQPLSLGSDPQRYLQIRMEKFRIAENGFDRGMFFEKLIFPAYHQGLARMLIHKKLNPCLCGTGWMDLPEFQNYATGPITTAEELTAALDQCDALIHPFPDRPANMLDVLSLPVIHPADIARSGSISAAPRSQSSPLNRGRILSLLPMMQWPAPDPTDPSRSVD